jgi:hypothetical protein
MATGKELLLVELATQAGIKQSIIGGGDLVLPDQATKAKLTNEFSGVVFGEERAPSPLLAPPLLERLELDTGYIAFSGGVPVGGYSHLSLFPNGAFSFTGHFHVSGAPSYNMELVWVIRSKAGTVYTFAHGGRVHGTFEAGSRNDDWGNSNTNPALAAAWADISAGYSWRWNAGANLDIGSMVDQAVKAIGQVAAVVAIVA